ncbi:MAG: tyrosine-type recombinase/integrase [Anaerolineae bacterium]|nr:tyrosine-type recombinase/integrase [Anaerolineae bacterium]
MGVIESNGLLHKFETLLSSSALAPATVANYLADLRAFLRWSEETRGATCSPWSLETEDIEEFCAYLENAQGQAPSTVNRRIQALRKFYSLAVAEGWTDENPAEGVSLLRESASERSRSLTPDDIGRLLAAVRNSSSRRAARDWAVIQLLLRAGLKLGELTELQLSDIHLDASQPYLNIRDRGDGPGRQVPLDAEVHQALSDYLARRRAVSGVENVCVNRDGKPLSTRSIQRLLRRYGRAAGLEGLTTQALRYVYASRVYSRSGDLKTVARRLGHRHLATTIRYLRSNSEE